MKKLADYINNSSQQITEAAAKTVHNPRKGSTIYIMKIGDTKAIPVRVERVEKIKTRWHGNSGGYDIHIELDDNSYDFTNYTEIHFAGNFNYSDEKYQCITYDGFYIGVSREAIKEYINSKAQNKLSGVLKQIEKLEAQLTDLYKEKEKIEEQINTEITESLKS